jgi:uncharacterized protein (DUF1501 family)
MAQAPTTAPPTPVFLAGPRVKAGLVGETPKMLDLLDGDLKMSIDFRRVYASVPEDWLGLPGQFLIGCQFRSEIPWNVRVWFG